MGRILVVDDEIHILRVLQEYLTAKKYEVYTAMNGLEAIQKVKDVKPHVVLLDIIMPGISGIDALRKIKEIDSKIVVIMVTAVLEEKLAEKAMQLGASEYITKPFKLKDMEMHLMEKIIHPMFE